MEKLSYMNENKRKRKLFLISIIVPVYNLKEYLEQCVHSLIGQTYTNLEILLVDDGATDGSGELCDALAREDARIRVIHKPNGGLVSAWKAGVEQAKGDYLHFVDGDDWINPETLEELAAHLTGAEREIISSDYLIERETGEPQPVWQQLPCGEYTADRYRREVLPNLLGQEERFVCLSRCMKLISKKLITDNMHYSDPSIRMGEDVTVMVPALMDCERLVILEHKAFYHYRYMESSMAHKYDKGLYENLRQLRKILHRIAEDKFQGMEQIEQKQGVEKEYLYLLFLVLKNEARGNAAGYRQNIRNVCCDPEFRQLLTQYPLQVRQKSNQLLYAVMKHPNAVMLSVLRAAMIWYYRK